MMPQYIRNVAGALTLLAFWLLTHRYFGIHHDGIFYAVQSIARDNPAAFRGDLFFAFGSQDDYTLFSLPYARLAEGLGLGQATLLLLVAAHLAWTLTAVVIARQWLHGTALWLGLALVFSLPRQFGSMEIFHYAEGFLTARSWAEPLVLLAVAASLGNRPWLALTATVGACLIHPIIALAAVMFVTAFHSQPGWRTVVLVVVGTAVLALLLPPAFLMDDEWMELVRRRAPFVLLDTWEWGELLEPLTWIGILLVAAIGAEPHVRRVCRALALAGAASLYLAALGTATHAALLIQSQPWRVLWLLKVVGLLALTGIFAQRWRRSAADRWLLAGLAAAAMTANTLGGPAALILAGIARSAWRDETPPTLPRWLPAAGGLALAVIMLESVLALLQQFGLVGYRLAAIAQEMPRGDLAAFLEGPLALLLPATLWLLLRLADRRPQAAALLAAGLLVLAAPGWYRARDPLQQLLFARSPERPFAGALAPTATVLWQDNFLYTWFLLRQGNYASLQQSVGVVFSRQTAVEAQRRLGRVATLTEATKATAGILPPAWQGHEAAVRQALIALCRDPVLDSVVLRQRLGDDEAPRWQDPVTDTPWFLHRCRDYRS
ncbi:hypothetical protein [Sulfurisoma sediminicola]|uniref:4-amino-4-deoxy-L-arabinose transferase-like glycosyltransferase n=1 Tax=Sulfurisoma sediminicola TaxID=1381557 RepID=A0A497XB12_9PROT|nr:hypothetical protein [Sulfurisoma sediminicola]RLJ63756.1 hypothetical protein DFR35_2388 [Sulfurisoma sediminicola]